MGNTASATADKIDDLIQKHLVKIHLLGYNDYTAMKETVCQLSETHFFQIESTRLIVAHKMFLKVETESRMKIIEENIKDLNSKIGSATDPYFLTSSIFPSEPPLSILSRQHLHSTLEDKLCGGMVLGYQEKFNLALQIVVAGILLHRLG